MARILRGDVIWADLEPTKGFEQAGHRPVLIISNDIFNEKSSTVIAVALTSQSQKTGFPLTLKLSQKIKQKTAWVKIGQIRTLSVLRLSKKISHLSEHEIYRVIEGLNEIIS